MKNTNFLNRVIGFFIRKARTYREDYKIGENILFDFKKRIFPAKDPVVIFDVGANIGQTVKMFNRIYPEVDTHCFEPVSETFTELVKNTGSFKNVVCHQLALGDKQESVEIALFDDKSVLNSLKKEAQNPESKELETITVTTGDEFCKLHSITHIDLLKIDTEGYEIEVLNGFKEMLGKDAISVLYCEVGFSPDNSRNTYLPKLLDFAHEHHFKFYGIYEIHNAKIINSNHYANMLLIHTNHIE